MPVALYTTPLDIYNSFIRKKLKSNIYRKAYSATVVIGYETQDLTRLRS